MTRRLRAHAGQVGAIAALVAIGVAVGAYVLAQQRLRFPWEDTYTIAAELSTAQAVTPGQGQVVAVAGVSVGEVASVRLREGRAVVEMEIERDRLATVHADARVLVRPKSGLQDMALQLDPGSPAARRLRDGEVLPVGATRPNVNLDEVLAGLDADARAYLEVLLSAAGRGTAGRGADLRAVFRAGAPTVERTRRVAGALAARDRELRRLVHALRVLAGAAAEKDAELGRLVDAGQAAVAEVARHDGELRASLDRLPGTLGALRGALTAARPFARRLGPTLQALRPAARDLAGALPRVDPLLRDARPAAARIRRLIGPALPVARDLDPTLADLAAVTPRLRRAFDVLNYVVNELGHNPDGPEEGYLFWLAWFAHNADSIFAIDDAHGAAWRGALLLSCSSYGALQQAAPLLSAAVATPLCPEDASRP
ncbi:MAG TPA: MlaD family protein [Solirubrobacteraceae bacterium]|nr:MlaD family protein [Solirubrobacteraceae bacterium]